jgi:hypothetical protein
MEGMFHMNSTFVIPTAYSPRKLYADDKNMALFCSHNFLASTLKEDTYDYFETMKDF